MQSIAIIFHDGHIRRRARLLGMSGGMAFIETMDGKLLAVDPYLCDEVIHLRPQPKLELQPKDDKQPWHLY